MTHTVRAPEEVGSIAEHYRSPGWPCLSVRQPWVWAILKDGKRCENRDWLPSAVALIAQAQELVGRRVLLHASKGCTVEEYEGAVAFMRDVYRVRPWGLPVLPTLRSVTRGAIVGSFKLTAVTYTTASGHRISEARRRAQPTPCLLCGREVRGNPRQATCLQADPWAIPGQIGLIIDEVEELATPIPHKGALGFPRVADEVLRKHGVEIARD